MRLNLCSGGYSPWEFPVNSGPKVWANLVSAKGLENALVDTGLDQVNSVLGFSMPILRLVWFHLTGNAAHDLLQNFGVFQTPRNREVVIKHSQLFNL